MVGAETAYRTILKAWPQAPDALFLLAMLLVRTERAEAAVPLLQDAISIAPGHAPFHMNLGSVFGLLGRHQDALASFDAALALDQAPADAHANRGLALVKLGRFELALAALDAALERAPTHVGALDNRGVALRELGQPEAALACHDAALGRQPNYAPAHVNRGATLQALARYEEALAAYDCALERAPQDPEAHNNRGTVLQALERWTEAEAAYDTALSLRPDYADALGNRAVLKDLMGQHADALVDHDAALALRADDPRLRFNAGVCRLRLGAFAAGWADFEHRWQTRMMADECRDLGRPRWSGEPVGTVLLHAEQGFGDTLQFCRFAPLVADRGVGVVLEVQASLVSLLRRMDPRIRVVARGEALPHFDAHCPLMSLPSIFATAGDTIPRPDGYLRADPDRVAAWRERLPRPAVGLVWAGSPRRHDAALQAADRRRSVRLLQLAPLAVPGVTFVSLQKGDAAAEAGAAPAGMRLLDPSAELADFDATAALVSALDLVISVDTAVAHLAGALGVPVWVLNRFDTCWRWLLGRDDSPWYRSVTLFRQTSAGDWDNVVERLRGALTARFGSRVG